MPSPSSPQQQQPQQQQQQQQNRPSVRTGGNGRRATYDRVSFAENHVSVVSYDEGGDDEDQDRLGRGGEGRAESASSPPPHDAAPSVRSPSSSSSATTLSSSAGARRNRSIGSLRASSSVSVSSSSSSLERDREESLPLAPSPSLSPSSSMLCGERERSGSHGMGAGERRKGGGGLSGATAATSTTTNSKVPPILECINVVILDAAHAKFNVAADPSWTVKQFKIAGYGQHRVPSRMQRLIYMGRLLRDEDTLRDSGLVETDKIVHLFPKPNVVVQKGRRRGGKGGADDDDDDDDEEKAGMTMIVPSPGGRADGAGGADAGGSGTLSAGGGAAAAATPITAGAHVPRIVLDAAEAERRSQILILSSAEVFEAQHRVKLLSFLLLVISSMELLTLFTIMLGVPSAAAPYDDDTYPPLDPTDTGPRGGHGGNGGNDEDGYGNQVRPWRTSDYFDLAVSSFGFYVATLGIKAATENSSRAARKYVYSLLACGVAWNAYYYYLSYRDLRDEAEDQRDAAPASSGGGAGGGNEGQQQQQNLDGPDLYTQAFFSILLPIFVWLICFVRAFQFRQLIEEAEAEAEERTRSFARNLNGEDSDDDDDDDNDDDEDEVDHIEDDRRGLHGNDVFGENDEGRAAASPSSSSGSSYSMTASAREGRGRGGGWTRAIPYGTVGEGEGLSLAGGTTTRRSAMDDLDSLELRVQAEGRMLT